MVRIGKTNLGRVYSPHGYNLDGVELGRIMIIFAFLEEFAPRSACAGLSFTVELSKEGLGERLFPRFATKNSTVE